MGLVKAVKQTDKQTASVVIVCALDLILVLMLEFHLFSCACTGFRQIINCKFIGFNILVLSMVNSLFVVVLCC